MIGKTISHFKILEKLGEGGMGVVYKAKDTKLERPVALKFLPPELTRDPDAKHRFVHEAKAASALQHNNICTIHEIDESDDGHMFIAMDCYEGETLKQQIARGPLSIEQAINIATQIAVGLEKAHDAGIIHRDIKPANIMVTHDGIVKILDFGLVKLVGQTRVTKQGTTVGTVAYMSPEQARDESVDHRTDIWSLGVVLYEMLTGQLPFKGGHEAAIFYSIANEDPKSIKSLKPGIPEALEKTVRRALTKDPNRRFSSATELLNNVKESQPAIRQAPLQFVKHPKYLIPMIIIVAMLVFIAIRLYDRSSRIRWARYTALPEAGRLKEQQKFVEAFQLIKRAERYIPDDPHVTSLKASVSMPISVQTDPSGAAVYYKDYMAPKAEWEYLGQTPMDSVYIPQTYLRWKITKKGFETKEVAPSMYWLNGTLSLALDPEESSPGGMLKASEGASQVEGVNQVLLNGFWIDKYEVTNKEYKEFVDAGGYDNREYWNEPFENDDRTLSWEEAMTEFRDATGRSGPSTWELGTYPEGKADYPVSGVSWFEAAAYAEYAGKSLPTLYHWRHAAGLPLGYSNIIQLSNFSGEGPAQCGRYQGLSLFGCYDMAGNVKEWCWNQAGNQRYISGGSWSEPDYMFFNMDARSPFDRSADYGFRCVKYDAPLPETLTNPINTLNADYSEVHPVPDAVFELYARIYNYDRTDLNPETESVDDNSIYWRKETITFDAAYGDERVIAYLYLPRNATPPYQAVIYFPAAAGLFLRSSKNPHEIALMDFIPRSGRALLFPVYKGLFEREIDYSKWGPNMHRDRTVQWVKDLGRSIDYLETRQDIDTQKLAYVGFSLGGVFGPVFSSLENRLRVSVLIAAGLERGDVLPEMDPVNFAPRCKLPTLMVNGRSDFIYPLHSSQEPLYNLLGSPPGDKRHAILEGGHFPQWNDVIRETLDWLDRYLGPVD